MTGVTFNPLKTHRINVSDHAAKRYHERCGGNISGIKEEFLAARKATKRERHKIREGCPTVGVNTDKYLYLVNASTLNAFIVKPYKDCYVIITTWKLGDP